MLIILGLKKEIIVYKVKAKDVNGLEGPWADPLPITMPQKYVYLFSDFFIRIQKWVTNQFFSKIK